MSAHKRDSVNFCGACKWLTTQAKRGVRASRPPGANTFCQLFGGVNGFNGGRRRGRGAGGDPGGAPRAGAVGGNQTRIGGT